MCDINVSIYSSFNSTICRAVCVGNGGGIWAIKFWEETETVCWLCEKYGHLARYCGLIRPYKGDYRMCSVDRRLEPREELLWEVTRVYGVVTCSFAKPAGLTGIVVGRYKCVWSCDL